MDLGLIGAGDIEQDLSQTGRSEAKQPQPDRRCEERDGGVSDCCVLEVGEDEEGIIESQEAENVAEELLDRLPLRGR